MRQVQSADFRKLFNTFLEPIEVVKYKERIGTWYPKNVEPARPQVVVDINAAEERANNQRLQETITFLEEDNKNLKRLLAAKAIGELPAKVPVAKDAGFGKSYAVPKPGKPK
jgi:hypothetical protein